MAHNPVMLSGFRFSMRRIAPLAVALGVFTVMLHGTLFAQPQWPLRAVRIIVVYPPGGVSDDTARAIAERLAVRLRGPVTVENRAGGGGSVGIAALAQAAPDGHVLAFSALSPLTLNPLFANLGYDPVRDIRAVAKVMETPVVVVGTRAFAGTSFADLIATARQKPGALRWATSGQATVGHMVLEHIRLRAGVDITHVPYKGGGQQLNDALAGHFEVLSSNVAAAQLQHIRAGRFKALAVGAPARLGALPDVPTLAELGHPQANLTSTFGLFAPGTMTDSLVERINAEVNAVLRMPEIRDRLEAANNIVGSGSAADFARALAQEAEANRRIVAAAGIKLE